MDTEDKYSRTDSDATLYLSTIFQCDMNYFHTECLIPLLVEQKSPAKIKFRIQRKLHIIYFSRSRNSHSTEVMLTPNNFPWPIQGVGFDVQIYNNHGGVGLGVGWGAFVPGA